MKWDDYLMPNTDVLKNNFGLVNDGDLDLIEKRFTSEAIGTLIQEKLSGYTLDDYKAIHRDIFKDVYPEEIIAGQLRKVDMMKPEPLLNNKTVDYCPAMRIDVFASRALSSISKIDFTDLDKGLKDLSREATELWVAHPFREGNTRTLAVFIKQVANAHNIDMNFTKLNENDDFRDSFVYAYAGNYSKIEKVLENAVSKTALSHDFSLQSKLKKDVPGMIQNDSEQAKHSSPSRKLK